MSALIIPVPAAQVAVDRQRRRLDPAARLGIPTHISVLSPFADGPALSPSVLDSLSDLFGRFRPFDFTLAQAGWFSQRVLYLAPTPAAPFEELTNAVSASFPEYPPYGGAFDDVIPHLTIGEGAPRWRLRRAERHVAPRLPIQASATEVWLMSAEVVRGKESWQVVRRFPLGRRNRGGAK